MRSTKPGIPWSVAAMGSSSSYAGTTTAIVLPSSTSAETDANEHAQRLDTVAPGDLLALRVRAAVVGDRELVDPQILPSTQAAGDLGLDSEIVFAQLERADHLRAECLVAGLHIGERRVEEHPGDHAQEPVSDQVPEQVGALRPAPRETRSVDDVGDALLDRLDQGRHLGRVVFHVGVLDHD